MLDKSAVINMLEDINRCLYESEWKKLTLSSIKQYRRSLLVATDETLRKNIQEYNQLSPDSLKSKRLKKKIDKRLSELYGAN